MLFWSRRSPSALFEQRFETEGDAYVFRLGRKGLPIRVSSSERNAFVAQFRYANRMSTGLLIGLLLAAVSVMFAVYFPRNQEVPERLVQVTVWLLVGGYMVWYVWVWFAPNRALAGRTPCGPPLTKTERRGRAIDLIGWSQVLALMVIGALLLADAEVGERMTPQIVKALIGMLLVGLGARAALIKFRRRSASVPKP